MLALDCVGDLSIGKYKRGEVTSRPRRDAASARRRFSHRFYEKLWRGLVVAPRTSRRGGGRCVSSKTNAAGVPIRGGAVSSQAQRRTRLPD